MVEYKGEDEPYSATIFLSNDAAICINPESFVTTSCDIDNISKTSSRCFSNKIYYSFDDISSNFFPIFSSNPTATTVYSLERLY